MHVIPAVAHVKELINGDTLTSAAQSSWFASYNGTPAKIMILEAQPESM